MGWNANCGQESGEGSERMPGRKRKWPKARRWNWHRTFSVGSHGRFLVASHDGRIPEREPCSRSWPLEETTHVNEVALKRHMKPLQVLILYPVYQSPPELPVICPQSDPDHFKL